MIWHVILEILCILLAVFAILLVVVCMSSIVVKISYWDRKFDWKLEFLGIPVLLILAARKSPETSGVSDKNADAGSRRKKRKDRKKEKKKDKKPNKKETGKSGKLLLADRLLDAFCDFVSMMDMAGTACYALPGTLRQFAKAISWCNIRTDITVGDEDAYLCARNYGLLQAGIRNLLAQAGTVIQVRQKEIRISYDFTRDETDYNFRFSCKLHVGKTIFAAVRFLVEYLKHRHKGKSVSKDTML